MRTDYKEFMFLFVFAILMFYVVYQINGILLFVGIFVTVLMFNRIRYLRGDRKVYM
jgi:hypothetical protein